MRRSNPKKRKEEKGAREGGKVEKAESCAQEAAYVEQKTVSLSLVTGAGGKDSPEREKGARKENR